MKILAVLAIAAFVLLAEGSLEPGLRRSLAPGLRIKFAMGFSPDAGTDYFFHVPLNVSEAQAAGWTRTRRPRNPTRYNRTPHLPQLTLMCAPGKNIGGLYDDNGHVAGLQVAIRKDEFTDNVLDWEPRGFQSWNTSINGQCVSMWTIQQYFVSKEYLAKSKDERLALRDPSRVLQQDAVWLTGTGGQLMKISNDKDIVGQGFTEQSCIPWMGHHFYYNMSSTTPCDAEHIYPWFPLTLDGQLIATGFMTFGTLPEGDPDYFERPSHLAVQLIVPHRPHCFSDMAHDPGALTMHIYYTNTPWLITC